MEISYKILKEREAHLLKELENALDKVLLNSFDIVLNGDPVRGSSISAAFFGDIIAAFQDILLSISEANEDLNANLIRVGSNLDLIATCSGSFRVILASHQPAFGESLAKKSLYDFNELIGCKDDVDLIKNQISKLGSKTINKYKKFLSIIYTNNANVMLYDKIKPIEFETLEINSDLAKNIYNTIVREEPVPDIELSLKGELKGISLFTHNFEFLTVDPDTEEEIKITGKFNKDLEAEVKSNFDMATTAKFKLSREWNEVNENYKRKWELLGFRDSVQG